MRRIKPKQILTDRGTLESGKILIVSDEGMIQDIIDDNGIADCEWYDGIITPGFINCHNHLELSHLQGSIEKHTHLDGFIKQLIKVRSEFSDAEVRNAIDQQDKVMWEEGTQAVGDICNTDVTIDIKSKSRIRYHSFIEVFDLTPEKSEVSFRNGLTTYNSFMKSGLHVSLTPHAPYTVTSKLHQLIMDEMHESGGKQYSIHFMETPSEKELFNEKKGPLFDFMQKSGVNYHWISDKCSSSWQSFINYLEPQWNILLVHNTFLDQDTLDEILNGSIEESVWLCLCPNANLYIENKLPDINMLMSNKFKLVIGTDSLASNEQLSVIEELNVIRKHYPDITTATLLTWATINGAKYFGWDDLGVLRKGTAPGLVFVKEEKSGKLSSERIL